MNVDELIAGLDLSEAQVNQLKHNLASLQATTLQGLADDVARAEEGSIMTVGGLDVLAKGIAGQQIKYTRVGIGDSLVNGELVTLTDEQCTQLTDLVNWREDIPIVDCKFAGNGTMVVQAMLQNVDFESGFWCREVGLFAEDPDTHEEVLYSYRNTGVLSSYTPSGQGAVILNRLLNLVTVVDNATNITAVVDAGLLYVSQAQHLDHINSYTPHPNIPKLKDELNQTPMIWANDNDNELHPITVENLTEQIFSGDTSPITRLSNRVAQNETNLANLYMQLDSLTELGLEANLFVFEDFDDCKNVDLLKTKVLNTVGGPSDVYVESLEGVLIGHHYTLSDGNRSQAVRVKSIACNSGLYNVMFDEPLTKTFNLPKTYLYRSTAVLNRGSLNGASDVTESTFAPDDVWQGVASSVTKTLTLSTTQKNAANFELSGNAAFDSSGFFTLA